MDPHILIEAVSPCVDGGRYLAKGQAGKPVVVEADIFRDGHASIRAVIKWKKKGDSRFEEAPLEHVGNDRFRGTFPLAEPGHYLFTVEAWTDMFGSWLADFTKKVTAGRTIGLDLE